MMLLKINDNYRSQIFIKGLKLFLFFSTASEMGKTIPVRAHL